MVGAIMEYAALATFYSLLALAILESVLHAWHVQDAPLAVRFRLPVLALPPIAPPLFALLSPERAAGPFRREVALFDLQNWLGSQPTPFHPGWALLLAAMAATTVVLVGLEVSGSPRHLFGDRLPGRTLPTLPEKLRLAMAGLDARGVQVPSLRAVDLAAPAACTLGLRRPIILLTTGLAEILDPEELQGVLAHEIAHAHRRDNWWGWLVFCLRLASFYNPVALFAFHQMGHDVERVCDAEAARVTGKPLALASALIKVYRASCPPSPQANWWPGRAARWATSMEDRARRTLVLDRAERLVHPDRAAPASYPWLRLGLAVAGVLVVSYLVV